MTSELVVNKSLVSGRTMKVTGVLGLFELS